MELTYLFKAILALIIVCVLLSLLTWALRRYGAGVVNIGKTMKVADTLHLDTSRRVVCIRRGKMNYLVLLGHKELLLDSWEDAPVPQQEEHGKSF